MRCNDKVGSALSSKVIADTFRPGTLPDIASVTSIGEECELPGGAGGCLTTGEKRSVDRLELELAKSAKTVFPFGCNWMQMRGHVRDYTWFVSRTSEVLVLQTDARNSPRENVFQHQFSRQLHNSTPCFRICIITTHYLYLRIIIVRLVAFKTTSLSGSSFLTLSLNLKYAESRTGVFKRQ